METKAKKKTPEEIADEENIYGGPVDAMDYYIMQDL